MILAPDGAPLRDVWWVEFDAGDTLWVATEDGDVLRGDPTGEWLPVTPLASGFGDERFRAAFTQSDGSVLLATRDGAGSVSLWKRRAGNELVKRAKVAGHDILAATIAPDGAVWFTASHPAGGSVYRIREGRADRVAAGEHRFPGLVVRGDIAYAADVTGLWILAQGRSAERIGARDGPPGGGPLLLDREGSLWLATWAGLVQYPEPETATWGVAQGLNNFAAEFVAVSPEGVWLSAWSGIGLLDRVESSWRASDVQDIYAAAAATRMCVDDEGALWLRTGNAAQTRWKLSSITRGIQRSHIPSTQPMDCFTTEDGSVLMIGDDAVYQTASDGELEFIGEAPPHDGRSPRRIAATAEGTVLVAAGSHVCETSVATLAVEGRAAWSCAQLPDVGQIQDLAFVRGPNGQFEPWLASFSGGVLRRADGEWRPVEATREIPQRATNGLFVSPRGGMWAFGFGFVVRLAPVEGRWEIVEQVGGWQGVPGEIRSLWEEPDGTLWLASWRGATRVPASARSRPRVAPTMRLVAFRVDGETQSPEAAIVPPDHRVVEIEFAAGALRDPRRVRYRIRLDGVEWIDTHEPVFRLAGIAPGEHEVEAAASLDGLLWSPSSEFRFRVRPPWYARGWLIALGATVLASAGIVAHRLRTRHLVDLERQRVRIAMDLHDELGAGLGSLGILGGVMADGSAPAEERQKLGELVARTAGELGGALHDIVYSLRTGEARLESLAEQLRVRGQTLFAGNGVRFTSSANRPPIRTVAPSVGRHVYRIAVEALHNAARHAGASHVGLGIEPVGRNGRIRVWVEDDGRGIEPTTLAEPGGMGLVTMRRRAEALGGELTIDSKPGRGTRIELSFDALGRRGPRVRWRHRRNVPNRRLSDGPSK